MTVSQLFERALIRAAVLRHVRKHGTNARPGAKKAARYYMLYAALEHDYAWARPRATLALYRYYWELRELRNPNIRAVA